MDARLRVLILQHPQEKDVDLGTASLVEAMLPGVTVVRPGLSWSSLEHALGEPVEASRWAVLYPHTLPRKLGAAELEKRAWILSRKGEGHDPVHHRPEGIVLLDGTWSQAKTLWWRNPWLVRLDRLVLHPTQPSAYGRLRETPRRDFLSTLETVAETFDALGEPPETGKTLRAVFRTLLQRARDAKKAETAHRKAVREPVF